MTGNAPDDPHGYFTGFVRVIAGIGIAAAVAGIWLAVVTFS